jgi:hypothetical protein
MVQKAKINDENIFLISMAGWQANLRPSYFLKKRAEITK